MYILYFLHDIIVYTRKVINILKQISQTTNSQLPLFDSNDNLPIQQICLMKL